LGEKFRKSRPDRLSRLAAAIEALGDRDQDLIEQSRRVDNMRIDGAVDLYGICRRFVDGLNEKLTQPAVLLSPNSYLPQSFDENGANLFQINLRGRLLQIEFSATDELYEHDDYRLPYILRGAVRSFSQKFLEANSIDEQMIFYCPHGERARWHSFDGRTYRSCELNEDFLAMELEKLV
jgi:hypothetical protein